MLRQDDFVRAQVVLFAWRQGREYGGWRIPAMIISVLANRVKAGWGSWLEVLQSAPKYAAHPYASEGMPDLWDDAFVALLREVDNIYAGTQNYAMSSPPKNVGYRPAQPAMYWADLRRITTPFFQNKIQFNPEHQKIGDMGSFAIFA